MTKIRESGMPDENMWATFFKPEEILKKLGLTTGCGDVVEFGCGYGTFSIPAAKMIQGRMYGFDINPEMIRTCESFAQENDVHNTKFILRDFIAEGTGLPPKSVDYVILFNILHAEEPDSLLQETWRILNSGGIVAVIHWNYDPGTPRGPSMEIRPRPSDCRNWLKAAQFSIESKIITLPPYHYGLIGRKRVK